MLISHLIFIFWCQTQMFSVYSKNKGIGLTVPILLEGSVYMHIYLIHYIGWLNQVVWINRYCYGTNTTKTKKHILQNKATYTVIKKQPPDVVTVCPCVREHAIATARASLPPLTCRPTPQRREHRNNSHRSRRCHYFFIYISLCLLNLTRINV